MAKCKDFQYTCTLDEDTLGVAERELNENEDTRLVEIKTLRDRLTQIPGLKAKLDPEFLIRFLRARKFDQERAFELVMNYYRMRKEDADIFTGLKPSCVAHVYDTNLAYPLPYRDRLGRKVYLITPAQADFKRYSTVEMFKVEVLNLLKLIEDEETQVRGFTILLDYKDFSWTQFLQMDTTFARRAAKLWGDRFPARMKNCLIVNEPTFVDMVLALFSQFAKAKHVKRIKKIGTDWDKLHEYIAPECLPARFGGTLPDEEEDPKGWVKTMMDSDKELEEESKFGFVDFTLTSDHDKKQEDAFTKMAGMFKKLDV